MHQPPSAGCGALSFRRSGRCPAVHPASPFRCFVEGLLTEPVADARPWCGNGSSCPKADIQSLTVGRATVSFILLCGAEPECVGGGRS
jgi:hypothetical protein